MLLYGSSNYLFRRTIIGKAAINQMKIGRILPIAANNNDFRSKRLIILFHFFAKSCRRLPSLRLSKFGCILAQ